MMIEHKPDDRVSIGQKLDYMINEQAAFGTNAKLKETDKEKSGKHTSIKLLLLSIGAFVLFALLCLGVIYISKSMMY